MKIVAIVVICTNFSTLVLVLSLCGKVTLEATKPEVHCILLIQLLFATRWLSVEGELQMEGC